MSQFHWDPIELPPTQLPFSRLDEQIERAFDAFLTAPWLAETGEWVPQLDLFESEDGFLIEADLPGVELDQLQVEVDGDTITIWGSRSHRRTEMTGGVVRVERQHGCFRRSLKLRQLIDQQNIEISQTQGVFRIRLPKLRTENGP